MCQGRESNSPLERQPQSQFWGKGRKCNSVVGVAYHSQSPGQGEDLAKRLKVQRAKLVFKGMKILFSPTSSYDLAAMCKYASGRH
jgi:hypothetical protein